MSRFSRGSNTIIYSALVVGIVLLANVVASRKFGRVDLTQDRLYTISEASKTLVRTLPDRMTIKAFVSRDLPPQVRNFGRYIRDMVVDYGAHSGGRLDAEVVYISDEDKEAQAEAKRFKVQPIKLGQYSSSKTSVQLAYLGVAFQYGGKVEVLPQARSINDLEYQISSTIRRLIRKKKPKVGFTTGHGEPTFARGLANAQHYLKDYDAVAVDLTEGKKAIPDDIAVLVIVGPTRPFAERALYEIDKFLMSGKGVTLFLDGMILETPRGNFQGQQPPRIARGNNTALEPMLAHWGIKLNADIVMDRQNTPLPLVAAGGRAVLVNYPAFPVVTRFSHKSPVTRHLKQALMVFPSSLELTKTAAADKQIATEVLASSTDASWVHKGFFLFDPMRVPKPTKDRGPFTLALSLKGAFPSYFSGRAVPAVGTAKPTRENAPTPTRAKRSDPGARLVVVGDADFIKDQYLRLNPDNLLTLLNAVDYLAQEESLIAIRAKKQTRRPLAHKDEDKVTLARWLNVVGVPVLFVLLGLLRWRWRSASRSRQAEELLAERARRRGVQAVETKEDEEEDGKTPPPDASPKAIEDEAEKKAEDEAEEPDKKAEDEDEDEDEDEAEEPDKKAEDEDEDEDEDEAEEPDKKAEEPDKKAEEPDKKAEKKAEEPEQKA